MTDDDLTRLFPTMRNTELAALMGVSVPTLSRRARALGLKKDRAAWRDHQRGPKSPEHRAAISTALQGRTFSDEARAKMSASRTGKVQTAAHRAAISAGNKGKPKPAAWRAKRVGRTLSDDVKAARKARMAARGTLPTGANHYGWKGGIVPRPFARFGDARYGVWRAAVLERDGYTCQECKRPFIPGQKGLHAHHVKPYAKNADVRYDPANGVALCTLCHRNHHTIVHVEDYERMEKVACACGCGEMIYPIDLSGRAVRYKQNHGRRGKTFTPESRAKIAHALKGRTYGPRTDEQRARMSAGRKGKGLGPRPGAKKGWQNDHMSQAVFIEAWATMTSREIAAVCHVSESTVCVWAKKLGLPPRYRTLA